MTAAAPDPPVLSGGEGVTGQVYHAELAVPNTSTVHGRIHYAALFAPATAAQPAASGLRQLTSSWWDVQIRQLGDALTWS